MNRIFKHQIKKNIYFICGRYNGQKHNVRSIMSDTHLADIAEAFQIWKGPTCTVTHPSVPLKLVWENFSLSSSTKGEYTQTLRRPVTMETQDPLQGEGTKAHNGESSRFTTVEKGRRPAMTEARDPLQKRRNKGPLWSKLKTHYNGEGTMACHGRSPGSWRKGKKSSTTMISE